MGTVCEALLFDHLWIIYLSFANTGILLDGIIVTRNEKLFPFLATMMEYKRNFDTTYLPFLNRYLLLGSLTK